MAISRGPASQDRSSLLVTMPLRQDTLEPFLPLTKQTEAQDQIISQIGEWPPEVYHEMDKQDWLMRYNDDAEPVPFRIADSVSANSPRLDGVWTEEIQVKMTRSRTRTPLPFYDTAIQDGYTLPGEGDVKTKGNCGRPYAFVWCPECDPGKSQLEKVLSTSCFTRDCPVCSKDWLHRQTENLTDRIYQLSREIGRFPRHIILSPPERIHNLSPKELKRRMKDLLEPLKVSGCLVIFHPWRFESIKDGTPVDWKHASMNPMADTPVEPARRIYSPHFHLLAFGFMEFSDKFCELSDGWVYVNLDGKKPDGRKRDQIFRTIWYQLSHTGIHKRKQAYSVHGVCHYSYWHLVQTSQDEEIVECPKCGCGLKKIRLAHDGSLTNTIEDYTKPCSFGTFEWKRKPPWLKEVN